MSNNRCRAKFTLEYEMTYIILYAENYFLILV